MSQSDKPAVSIVKCAACDSAEGIADGLRHACDLVGGLESVIMPGDTVLIKPNLVLPLWTRRWPWRAAGQRQVTP